MQTRMRTRVLALTLLIAPLRADKPVADCAGQPDDTPCQYGDVKIIGYCSANKCVELFV
jgi:hypothetical protein